MRRGYTLVELMITVAIIGISTAIIFGAARTARLHGLARLQGERALLLLEYHADCAVDARPVEPAVVEQLTASLPDARVSAEGGGGTTTLTVHWRPPVGLPQQRSLTVFVPAGVR